MDGWTQGMVDLLDQDRLEGVTPLGWQAAFLELLRKSLESSFAEHNHRIGRYRQATGPRPA